MRKFLIAAIVLVVLAGIAYAFWPKHQEPPPVADQSTLRQTPLGPVVGFTGARGANVWLGIPYAAPPVGELRWKAPRPAQPWTTPRNALAIGNMCVQFPSLLSGAGRSPKSNAPVGDEDCLYANVWAPPFSPGDVPSGDKARPVMFWIHGGGNSIGHGGSYSGAHLATAHNVVVVTFNYRLGPFGWFSHPALRSADASAEDNSGNYGLLDSIAALQWVRDNIAAFGGDPNKVTIFGESAGGGDVLALMASPLAKGLFQNAIVESGGFFVAPRAFAENYHDDATPGHPFSGREVVNRLLVRAGKAGDAAAAKTAQNTMSDEELRTLLTGATAADIMTLYEGGGFGMINAPEMFGDGAVLPLEPDAEKLFADPAQYNAVPVILGTNRDEPALFMVRDPQAGRNPFVDLPAPQGRSELPATRSIRRRLLANRRRRQHRDRAREIAAGPGVRLSLRLGRRRLGDGLRPLDRARRRARPRDRIRVRRVRRRARAFVPLSENACARSALEKHDVVLGRVRALRQPRKGRDGSEVQWLPWGTDGKTTILLDTTPPGIRMSSDLITVDSLKQRLIADTSITDQREHCELYAQTFRWDWFDKEQYLHLGKEGCAAYDPESFRRF